MIMILQYVMQGTQSYITDQGTGGLYLRYKRTSYIFARH